MDESGGRPGPRIPVDPDCLQWAIPVALAAIVGWVWGVVWIWAPAVVLLAALIMFFRDPARRGDPVPGAIWSPADGKVVAIDENTDPIRGPVPGTRIAIFLSVLNCHINRSPCAGVVQRIRYEPGRFLNALDPESGNQNECNWIFIRSGTHDITVRQIAGLIARRIVCRIREEQSVARGQRIGLIRFGSRTELYLPPEAEIKVRVGQQVRGASSLIAILKDE